MGTTISKRELASQLLQEVRLLHSNFEQIIQKYGIDVLARIEHIMSCLDPSLGNASREFLKTEEACKLPKKREIELLLEKCRSLTVKEDRARLKDIRRIQALVDEISGLMPD